jgi:hypothetical protein
MDFTALGKMAMELGVIPTLALYLIVSLHRQNKRLTDMVEKRGLSVHLVNYFCGSYFVKCPFLRLRGARSDYFRSSVNSYTGNCTSQNCWCTRNPVKH